MRALAQATLIFVLCAGFLGANSAHAEIGHVLRFTGVSTSQGQQLQAKFPFVSERKVTLAEVDDIVRYLMKTGLYSNIDVVARETATGPELLLVATTLRKISSITIKGHRAFSAADVKRLLKVEEGAVFERKELIEAVKTLQVEYRKRGYRSMNAEIEFETPNETNVDLRVIVSEGPAVVIDRIQIDAGSEEARDRAERVLKPLRGKALNEDTLQDKLVELNEDLHRNRYLTARVLDPQPSFDEAQSRVRLTIPIENPWRYQFRFEGNTSFSESTVIRNMNLDQLVGTVTTPAPELAERIRRFYQSRGYAHVEVTSEEKAFDERFVKEIAFKINEGPRVRVKRIEISGNISRSATYYAKFIESSSSDIVGEGFYNRRDIEEGIKRLEEELQNQGYLRAKVKSWRTEFSNPVPITLTNTETSAKNDRGSQATLLMNIDEGPMTVIRQIRFSGVEAFSKLHLQSLLPIKTGESLRIRDLNASIETLRAYYFSQGFVEMKLLNEQEGMVSYNETSTQATVEFEVQEGPKVSIGSVVLEGNTFTKDEVILRELDLKPGEVYTPELREESISRLQKLELFSRVNVKTLEEGTSIAERTVIIEVEEKYPGAFESGVGVLFDPTVVYRGYLGIVYRNLWGTGRLISGRVDPSYSSDERISYLEHKITLSYLEPYVFRDRNKARVNLVRELKHNGFDGPNRTIIQQKNEFTLQIERDFARYVKGIFTAYSLSSQNEFIRQNDEIVRTQNIAKIGPLVEYDSRDNIFYPTKGAFAQLSADYSDPLLGSSEDIAQSIKFVKVGATLSAPYRIAGSPRWIFASSLRVGYLSNLSDRQPSGVPDSEAFFLGGRSTIRGYQPTGEIIDLERIPNLVQLGKTNSRDFYVTSDSSYMLFKAELRFPIYGDMHGAVFYDGGAVVLSHVALDDPYRDSVGLAVRYLFPGGIAASFEYGEKLDRKQWGGYGHEKPGAFHLSIGTF